MIVVANTFCDPGLATSEEVLGRYRSLTGWAGALVQAGADGVAVVQEFHRDQTVRLDGVTYHFVAGGPETVARAISRLGPEVVHVNGMIFPLRVRHLRWRLPARTALVVQDHGGVRDEHPGFRSWTWRARHRFGLRAADGFLFTARALAAPWQRAGIIGAAQPVYEIIEASSDLLPPSLEGPAEAAGAAADPLPGQPALLWVGALDANKDPLTILDGFEQALPRLPEAVLTMVFIEAPLLPEVQRRVAASARLVNRVRLVGWIDHARLPALYQSADLFVLGSRHEASGYALIEAQAFGVTPVVTDIPAFRVITGDGHAGRLYPVGDAAAFARAVEELGATDLRARRNVVRAHFEGNVSWPALGRRALEIYRDVLERRQRGV